MSALTFYDLASNKGAISPFTWRVRLALNYKRIPYKTHWLKFTEIEPHFKSIGAPATGKRPYNGADFYTCPVMQTTDGQIIAGSDAIIEHLETAFPDAPSLFPPGTHALQAAYVDLLSTQALATSVQILVPGVPSLLCRLWMEDNRSILKGVPDIVDPASAEYFRTSRKAWFGTPLEEWVPFGSEKRRNAWKAAEEGWGKLAAVHRKSEGTWLTGDQPVFADLVMLALFCFMQKSIPEEEWEVVLGWHDGIWDRLWQTGQIHMSEE
ncbi:hypothetical protein AURDEDRAFT_170146 [Auricularia subglabra TFB-10046 SS5]|nr:hypothetical protein AURDEDRAFT_170146 [Auricularia subglabra TFB-10046 SS5]